MLTAAREECPHGSPVGCHECDMRLAEPLAGGPRADPGLWPGRHTEADDLPKSITRRPPGRGSTALTRDLARTGAAGVPSWAPAPPRPAVSLTGAALLVSSSRRPSGYVRGSGAWATGTDVTALPEYGVTVREAATSRSSEMASRDERERSGVPGDADQGTWRLGLRLVYGFNHGPVLSVRRRDGVKAPPGALTPRRGRCVKRAWVTWGQGRPSCDP